MHIPENIIWGVISLYGSIRGRFRALRGLSDWVESTIEVKQDCPFSPTLVGLYIDEITSFIDHFGGKGSLLANLMIEILLYANDIILLSSSAEGV